MVNVLCTMPAVGGSHGLGGILSVAFAARCRAVWRLVAAVIILIGMASPLWERAWLPIGPDASGRSGFVMADHGHIHAADLHRAPDGLQPLSVAPFGADHVHEATLPASGKIPDVAVWLQRAAPPVSDELVASGVNPGERPPRSLG